MADGLAGTVSEEVPPSGPVAEFTGRRGALARLLVKNTLLKILTLGIYRFWAKTAERRYFWSNVRLFGDPLEYTGLPSELFIGFLMVIAILVPFGLVFQGLGTAFQTAPAALQVAANLAYYAALYLLVQVAFFRMWRYRLTRTTWRGIRFGLDGSTWAYTVLAVKWTLLLGLTLGVAYPWMRVALSRYRLSHTRFGGSRFSFEGTGRDLLGVWIPANLALLVAFALLLWFAAEMAAIAGITDAELRAEAVAPRIIAMNMANIFVVVPTALLFYIWYRVREVRYVMGRLSFGEARFESQLKTSSVLVAAILTGVFVFVVTMVVVVATMVPSSIAASTAGPEVAAMFHFLGTLMMFLGVLIAMSIAGGLVFRYQLVKAFCRTLSISDPEALSRAIQSVEQGPAYGEGLADAFDVGAF